MNTSHPGQLTYILSLKRQSQFIKYLNLNSFIFPVLSPFLGNFFAPIKPCSSSVVIIISKGPCLILSLFSIISKHKAIPNASSAPKVLFFACKTSIILPSGVLKSLIKSTFIFPSTCSPTHTISKWVWIATTGAFSGKSFDLRRTTILLYSSFSYGVFNLSSHSHTLLAIGTQSNVGWWIWVMAKNHLK